MLVPAWIPHEKNESLSSYAERFSRGLKIREFELLGGVSLGGMLALEMSRYIRAKKILLVASCDSPQAIPGHWRVAARIVSMMPGTFFEFSKVLPLPLKTIFGVDTPAQEALLRTMLKDTQASFLKWGLGAIAAWEPQGLEKRIYKIHGDADRLIRPGKSGTTEWVPGGSHAINLTHPRQVNDFIRKILAGKKKPQNPSSG
jgi:pimeloyl-ACP methyl ester carboxylesterase